VPILCFISLLILCLEIEVIKSLLWPLNEPASPLKNGKNQQKMAETANNGLQLTSIIATTILELEKSDTFSSVG